MRHVQEAGRMTEHPLAQLLPEMILFKGTEHALTWWMTWAMECPNAIPDCRDAIDAMVKGDHNRIIVDEDGGDLCRAFHLVRIFDLDLFVEAERLVAEG
jgi:hypothetical protein